VLRREENMEVPFWNYSEGFDVATLHPNEERAMSIAIDNFQRK